MKKIMSITGWTKDDWIDHALDFAIWGLGIGFAFMLPIFA